MKETKREEKGVERAQGGACESGRENSVQEQIKRSRMGVPGGPGTIYSIMA
jgi:hypothetical protein